MSSEWIGKDEPWPIHPRAEAQKALKYARSKGFLFRKSKGHAYGRLRCDDEEDPCEMSIHSTSGSSDGSATAGVVRDLVRKCPHQTPTVDEAEAEDEAVCAELSMRLGDCERLLDAAEELMARDSYQQDFEYQLEQSSSDDDEHFAAAVEMEGLAAVAEQESLAIVAQVRPIDDWPPANGAQELFKDVSVTLADAESATRSMRTDCPGVLEELEQLRARLARLTG